MSGFAIAARELEGTPRGVGRWLGELLREVAGLGRAGEITLVTERGLDPGLGLGEFEIVATGPAPGGGATGWEQLPLAAWIARARPRAFLGPAYSLPLRCAAPAVVALHDLSFEANPAWFTLREGFRRRSLARLAARRARSILALSRFGRDEIVTRYGIPAERIHIVGAGVSERFSPVSDTELLARARSRIGRQGEIVLSVGSLFTRRRPERLIAAFGEVLRARPDALLVLVGDDRSWPPLELGRRIAEAGIESCCVWLEEVEDVLLPALYTLARVTVYLSDYEGFGLPPLEALACDCPVIASRSSALIENLEGRATLLDASEPRPLAAAIHAALEAPPRPRLRPAWLDRFAWRATAGGVLAALEEAAS